MVCMGLRMSPRILIQKRVPPSCFPTHLPRDAKIAPKCVPTIYKEGSWALLQKAKTCPHSPLFSSRSFLIGLLKPKTRIVNGWRGFGLDTETANLAGVPTHVPWRSPCYSRFGAFSGGISGLRPLAANYLRFHNGKPCFPGSGWRRSLLSARYQGTWRPSPSCTGRLTPIWRSIVLDFAPATCGWRLKSHWFSSVGTIWGLWIAGIAKYSPDLRGQPCRVSVPCVRDDAWVFSSWGAYVAGLLSAETLVLHRRGPHLGELSGGNWIGRL